MLGILRPTLISQILYLILYNNNWELQCLLNKYDICRHTVQCSWLFSFLTIWKDSYCTEGMWIFCFCKDFTRYSNFQLFISDSFIVRANTLDDFSGLLLVSIDLPKYLATVWWIAGDLHAVPTHAALLFNQAGCRKPSVFNWQFPSRLRSDWKTTPTEETVSRETRPLSHWPAAAVQPANLPIRWCIKLNEIDLSKTLKY